MPVHRRKSVFAVVAVLLCVLALPASAHPVPIDTSGTCPASIPSAGFIDVGGLDTATQHAIDCLFAFDISRGVTGITFEPNGVVTRWQMAHFMIRAAIVHNLAVPAPTDQGFTDIAGFPQETQDAINRVAVMKISTGTSATTFDPNGLVTRWQMALFLHRLAERAGVTVVDDPTGDVFTDIAGYSAEIQAAINFLADGHIALGTSEGIFSGGQNVLRSQMALFITRLLAADGTPPSSG